MTRFGALVFLTVAGTLLGTTPAARAQKTITLPHMFDPDLADVKSPDKITNAVAQANQSKTPPDCTSARVTVRASSSSKDKSFETSLGEARAQALAEVLKAQGFKPPQYETDWMSSKDKDSDEGNVEVIFDEDKQAPILKVTSDPPKGHKVKPQQTIKVTIFASERQEDGHNNWPTGVQTLQLKADDAVVGEAEYYGKSPPPCVPRTIGRAYLVPENPPPVVHLVAIADDAVGNESTKPGEFPTDGDWYGTLKGHGQGNIYNDTAEVSFNFTEEADGTIKGKARAKVTSEEQPFAGCRISRKPADPFDFTITGRRVENEFQLELENPRLPAVFSYSGCKGGA